MSSQYSRQVSTKFVRLAPEVLEIDVGWGKVRGVRVGNAEGPLVVTLHGWLDNLASFSPMMPFLEEFQWVHMDLAGHGLSDHHSVGFGYQLIDTLGDLLKVIRHFGLERAKLVGHSLGGSIASLFAGAFPELVERLVLIEAMGPLTAPEETQPEMVRDHWFKLEKLPMKNLPCYASLDEAAAARQRVGDLSLPSARMLAERGTRPHPQGNGITWRTDQRLTLPTGLRMTESQVEAFLAKIRCPTMLVQGDRGLGLKYPEWTARCAKVPQLEVVTLPGGHHLHMETPEPVARALRKFLLEA